MNKNKTHRSGGEARRGALVFLALGLLSLLPIPAAAQDESVSLAFVGSRRLAVIGRQSDGQVILVRPGAGFQALTNQALRLPFPIRQANEVLKKDKYGQLYLVWEELGLRQSGVGFGRLTESGSVEPERIRLPAGWNRLPDLGFDAGNGSWLTWVNDQAGEQVLYVRQTATGRTWRAAGARALLRPRILGDSQGRLWLFWGETSGTSFRVVFRVFAGGRWSPTLVACDAGPLAIGSFDAAVDDAGEPWVAWSQFSRGSYGIHVRQKSGASWSAPLLLSTDPRAQNIGPSISLASGLGPVVAWVRSSGKDSALCVRVMTSGLWNGEVRIPGVEARRAIPQVTVEDGWLGVAWLSQGGPTSRVLSLSSLAVPSSSQPQPWPASELLRELLGRFFPLLIINPALNEASYIGFGDSITYGVINSEYHPELGYVPRLEALLTDNFGLSKVYNEGKGSEITANGLARLDEVLAADLARYLLILEGTNDTVTLIYNPDVTAFNLRQMVGGSRNFGSFPAMGTLLPRFDDAARPERIAEVNTRIHDLARFLSVPLVDFYTLFNGYPETEGGVMSLLSDDKLHPNEKGYQFMAEKWFEAIQGFPFPPSNVQARREVDKIFFYQNPGNRLTWEDSPKIFDKTKIQGYHLYRKLSTASDDAYVLIANVLGERNYFDTAIAPESEYTYAISTVMTDGVEGPGSVPVTL